MKRNVVVLFGINGVGKSTIASALQRVVAGSVTLSGSELLMRAFKGLDRSQLEVLSPEEKMRMLEPAFLDGFHHHKRAPLVILDTHLVVPIRKDGRFILENVWSEQFAPHVKSVFFVLSKPREILERRIRDAATTGRKRDLDIDHIRRDQEINLSVFEETFSPAGESLLIQNKEHELDRTVASLVQLIC